MGTAIKHPVPDRVKLSFVIFDIWTLWRSAVCVRVPRCPKITNSGNPVWHTMLYSCTHMATVGVKRVNRFVEDVVKLLTWSFLSQLQW